MGKKDSAFTRFLQLCFALQKIRHYWTAKTSCSWT